jgi:hypothetical protein
MKNEGHSASHLMCIDRDHTRAQFFAEEKNVRFACHPEVRAKKSGM